jgi:hypothetical protein
VDFGGKCALALSWMGGCGRMGNNSGDFPWKILEKFARIMRKKFNKKKLTKNLKI